MAKPIGIRIPDDISGEIAALAKREYRPYATMVVVLAREGLRLRSPEPPRVTEAEMDAMMRAAGDHLRAKVIQPTPAVPARPVDGPVDAWIAAQCVVGALHQGRMGEMFKWWGAWDVAHDKAMLGKRNFAQEMERLGYPHRPFGGNVVRFEGVALKPGLPIPAFPAFYPWDKS